MGVLGLWQLLQPTSRPTKLQALEGKTLAIDVSIWLHQATKGVRNSSNGHLSVLYNRICKLLYFKIKPIFVFDGPNIPKLKERILRERQRKRNEAAEKGQELDDRIKKNLLEAHALKNALGNVNEASAESLEKAIASATNRNNNTANKAIKEFSTNIDDDMFKLPEEEPLFTKNLKEEELEEDDPIVLNDDEDSNEAYRDSYLTMENIDKDVFENLPPEIQIELLSNYKEALKAKKSQTFEEFPDQSDDFSKFQLKSLLHKSEISNKITNLKNSIKSTYTNNEFENFFHQKVASEDDRQVVLITKKSKNEFKMKNALETILASQQEQSIIDTFSLEKMDNKSAGDKEKPTFEIQFDENNKLELVPTQLSKKSSKIDLKIDEEKSDISLNDEIFRNIREKSEYKSKIQADKHEAILLSQMSKSELEEQFLIEQTLKESIETSKSDSNKTISNNTEKIYNNESKMVYEPPSDLNASIDKNESSTKPSTSKEVTSQNSSLNSNQTESLESDDDDFVEVEPKINNEPEILLNNFKDSTSQHIEIIDLANGINGSQEGASKIEHIKQLNLSTFRQSEPEKTSTQSSLASTTTTAQSSAIALIHLDSNPDYNIDDLLRNTNQMIREKQNIQRLANSIDSIVIEEAKHLIRLFGLPFIESPGEAEAQCAYLDLTNQTDGSITEDSDIWLFGAKRVYKNFFGQDLLIDSFDINVIKAQLGLDRDSLICIAMLVGSDYTEGIEHVGVVKAMEIFQEIEGSGMEKLLNFKKWHQSAQDNKERQSFNKIRKALVKLKVPDSFPSEIVYNAYTKPNVDNSNEEFKWSMPELDLIRKYLCKKMSWTIKKIDDDLLPVIKRLNDTKVQKTIDSFFVYQGNASNTSKQSKRMTNAINLFKTKSTSNQNLNENLSLAKKKSSEDFNLSENDDKISISSSEEEKSKKKAKNNTRSTNTKTKKVVNKKTKAKSRDKDDEIIILEKRDVIMPTTSSNTRLNLRQKRKSNEPRVVESIDDDDENINAKCIRKNP